MTVPTVTLGEAAVVLSGFAFKSEFFSESDGMPLVRIRDVTRGYTKTFYTGPYSKDFLVEDGDILVGMDGNFEAARWKGGAALLNQRVCRISGRPAVLDDAYLFHFLAPALKKLEDATPFVTVKHLSVGDVRGIEIPLQPLPEQRRIAAILDRADALRAKRREALAQLDSLTQSIFIEMFGDPRRPPAVWPLASLKSLGRVMTGRTPPSSKEGMFGGEVPFITPGDLDSGEPAKRTLSAAGVEELNPVRAGAALVCCIGTVGKMGMAKTRSGFNQQINAVDWSAAVDDTYGLSALQFLKDQLSSQAASTTVPILNKSAFEKFEIQVPPLSLQQTFAYRIQAVEELKATHRAALIESDALFSSLQHRAFAGQLS